MKISKTQKTRIFRIICVLFNLTIILISLYTTVVFIGANQPKDLRNRVSEGKLYRFSNNKEYLCGINDYCIKDGYLYVLFEFAGVLKVYDNNGTYLRSFAFETMHNGVSAVDICGKYVYLQDQRHNFYVFCSGESVDFIKNVDYGEYLDRKQMFVSDAEKREEDNSRYFLRFSSIYRASGAAGSVPVVKRPLIFMCLQQKAFFIVMPLFMSLIIVLNWVKQNLSQQLKRVV